MRKIRILKQHRPREIVALIDHEKREKALKNKLQKYHAYDISQAMLYMDKDQRERLYSYISLEKLARAFEHLYDEKAAEFMLELDKEEAAKVLETMESDDAVDILQHLEHEESVAFLSLLDEGKRERLRKLSRYKHLTAGSEMNPEFITFTADMDVKDAMRRLIEKAGEVETIETLFVVDDQNVLQGVVNLKDLIVAKHPITIKEIMSEKFYAVNVLDGIQKVVKDIQKYDTTAMPVLNDNGVIEGIITMYDAMDIIEEEAHDDYAKLAGIPTEDDLHETAKTSAAKRFPWLALLLVLNILVATVLASFEATIAQIAALVFFQPLILDMAGNIGTQSLAVTVLRISRETLQLKFNIGRHLLRETMIGVLNGAILGILAFLTAFIFLSLLPIGVVGETVQAAQIATVVAISIFLALTVSAFLGSAIPILLNAAKIDPAVASGPLITTLNDIVALFIYFGLATAMIIAVL